MYRKAILLGLQFLLFNLEVGASSYEVVWEKEFDKPISKVVWAYENDTLYPKVLVIGKSEVLGKTEVRFLNPSGEVEAQLKFRPSRVYISPNGRYVGVETFIPREDEPMWPKESYFRLYNDKGELLWQMERALAGYGDPEETYIVLISNKGTVAVLRFDYGGIDFYDIYGNRKIVVPFENAIGWNPAREYTGKWSSNGSILVVGVTKYGIRRISPEPWLIAYDEHGNELWRHPVEGRYVDKIAVSPSGRYIIVSVGGGRVGDKVYPNQVYIVNNEGITINKIQVAGVWLTRVAFSPDESKFAVFIPKDSSLYMVKSITGEILWARKINLGVLSNAMSFTSNDELIVAKLTENKTDASGKIIVYTIGVKGEIIELTEYDVSYLTGLCLFSTYLGIHESKSRKLMLLKIIR